MTADISLTTPAVPTDPQALAEAVATAMWARDRAANALGMRIDEVRPGYARLSMPVRGDMVNGHHICHGGLIFSLADTAFAYACNSYNRNTVASACHIDFLAPGKEGDTLAAEAV
ncbi:MAG: hydroxyphenylacetyl-CoA thioesterase PaaI, partial [Zoogloea sp.]|nr:hydroxyphenylacetyl-CoA thioesterase PaaI [Zoogloea sp.]